MKKQLNFEIGTRIKKNREKAGLTQEQLAERIGKTPQYISDLERGVTGAKIDTLIRLCTTLNTTSDSLLFESADNDELQVLGRRIKDLTEEQRKMVMEAIDLMIRAFKSGEK